MSDEFRRLGEVLDPLTTEPLPFSPETKSAAAWVQNLPRADVLGTRRQIQAVLDTLTSAHSKGGQRFDLAEALRPAVIDTALLVTRQYANRALPLPSDLKPFPEAAIRLHLRLADAYRIAAADLCAPTGNLPWLKGGTVSDALGRALHHYGEALWVAWRVYLPAPAHIWRAIHRVARFADARQLMSKSVKDPLGETTTLQNAYVRLCLMGVFGPVSFSAADQERLWQVGAEFAPASSVPKGPYSKSIPIADDEDAPPNARAKGVRWLDVAALSTAVDRALGEARGESVPFGPTLATARPISVETLVKLQRAFTQATQREFLRLAGGHRINTVIGLAGLHFHLSGEHEFESLARQVLPDHLLPEARSDWQRTAADAAQRAPKLVATAVDQSLGGYRMMWDDTGQARVRVGEVVGLCADDGDHGDWMLGLVRWVRYEPDGRLYAGVEMVSRDVRAVVLGFAGRTPQRALELRPLDGTHDFLYLTAQRLALGDQVPTVARDMTRAEQWLDQRPDGLLTGLAPQAAAGEYPVYRMTPTSATGFLAGAAA